MNTCSTYVSRFPKELDLRSHRRGISLHSHTMHSREYLGRFPEYISHIPIASFIIEREVGRAHLYKRCVVDFRRIYWTPPLSAREAFRLEARQIEEKLGLAPLVSLTDHDNIEAGLHLSMLQETAPRLPPVSPSLSKKFVFSAAVKSFSCRNSSSHFAFACSKVPGTPLPTPPANSAAVTGCRVYFSRAKTVSQSRLRSSLALASASSWIVSASSWLFSPAPKCVLLCASRYWAPRRVDYE
jgi:hypothetical protein